MCQRISAINTWIKTKGGSVGLINSSMVWHWCLHSSMFGAYFWSRTLNGKASSHVRLLLMVVGRGQSLGGALGVRRGEKKIGRDIALGGVSERKNC
jgi:hypothetical protein